MASAEGLKEVGYFDCAGGGQIRVDGTTAYIGHMANPFGTSIVDVADPMNPKLLSHIEMPEGMHSHKVHAQGDLMVRNHELIGPGKPDDFHTGVGVYDVSDKTNPKLLSTWDTVGRGVHRFDFDGRYMYFSSTVEGYRGPIMVVLDLKDPERPVEVCKWWVPGQWEAGGEEYPWNDGPEPRCHHPLRMGNRLYMSYWHHGVFILDIDDLANPKMVSSFNTGPTFPHPTHTALPLPFDIGGHRHMIVADEDVAKLRPHAPAFMWIFDITDETNPIPISSWQVNGLDMIGEPEGIFTGCHQPSEIVTSTVIPFAWFARGVRLIDIANPHSPEEVGHFEPEPQPGCDRICANDITVDDRGLIYVIDRLRGFHILEQV